MSAGKIALYAGLGVGGFIILKMVMGKSLLGQIGPGAPLPPSPRPVPPQPSSGGTGAGSVQNTAIGNGFGDLAGAFKSVASATDSLSAIGKTLGGWFGGGTTATDPTPVPNNIGFFW